MTPDRANRISDLYHAAVKRPAGDRIAFLIEACEGDAALREEVESLLRYESASAGLLETPAVQIAGAIDGAPVGIAMVGRQLGPYTITAPLGAGGMGAAAAGRRAGAATDRSSSFSALTAP